MSHPPNNFMMNPFLYMNYRNAYSAYPFFPYTNNIYCQMNCEFPFSSKDITLATVSNPQNLRNEVLQKNNNKTTEAISHDLIQNRNVDTFRKRNFQNYENEKLINNERTRLFYNHESENNLSNQFIIDLTEEEPLQPPLKKLKLEEKPKKLNLDELDVNQYQEYLLRKMCEICRKGKSDDLLLLCDYCDDAYHSYCLAPALVEIPAENEIWVCPLCLNGLEEQNKKLKKKENEITKIEVCQNCNINLKEDKKECLQCKNSFHENCFHSKKNKIICFVCEQKIKKKIKSKTISINNNNKINEHINCETTNKKNNNKLKRKGYKKVNLIPKKPLFKLPKIRNELENQKQKENFFFAFAAKHIEFSDDLVYLSNKCTSENNNSILEPNLRTLDRPNYLIFIKFKEISRNCNYVPVLIEQDDVQGFVVRAYEEIPELTLICEYVGEVDFSRNRIFDKNDSIMDLLRTTRSSTSLVICPEKYGNLARFISGINNYDEESRKKQNVNSVRYSIDGQARVILYARRKIKAGELLYYDYNAGGFFEYPTEKFI